MSWRRSVWSLAGNYSIQSSTRLLARSGSSVTKRFLDCKTNQRNTWRLCQFPEEVPVAMRTKFPTSVMVLGVVTSNGDVMLPYFLGIRKLSPQRCTWELWKLWWSFGYNKWLAEPATSFNRILHQPMLSGAHSSGARRIWTWYGR